MLKEVNQSLKFLSVKDKKKDGVDRLYKNFDPDNITENIPGSTYNAYSVNKGEELSICIREKNTENFIDKNTIMFVAIHELSHMMSIDMDLGMVDMNEEISDYEMVVYKVEGITADMDEGGPDEPFEMEVKLESSLSADEVKDAIRDAARKEQGKLYKLDYKKA